MYASFFGFNEKPFNITPDPRFFYSNPLYNEVYANLLYAVKERKGFAALTGEVGTGKTTLLRKLMDDLALTARFVYFYNTNLTFEELLTFLCEELRLQVGRGDGRLGQIRALNRFLLEQRKKGGTGVLLIDEAQNLGQDVLENLRLLSNMETPTEKLLQIVLVGQPELKTKLDQPELRQLRQRIPIYCRLESLKEKEVGPFINYRLRAVGCKRDGLFTPEAIRKVAFHSNGIPRLVNVICDNALLIAYGNLQHVVSAEVIDEVAHDLESGMERRPIELKEPAFEAEAEKRADHEMYSTAGNVLDERSMRIDVEAAGVRKRERAIAVAPATGVSDKLADDFQPGAERGRDRAMELPAEATIEEGKNDDLYSKPDNGLNGDANSGAVNQSAAGELLHDGKPRSAESETSIELMPPETAVFQVMDIKANGDSPITLSVLDSRFLNKVDGRRNVKGISQSLGLPYLPTAKVLLRLNRLGLIKRVSNDGKSETVPTEFLDVLSSALTDAMGPMARLVIRDGLAALGYSFTTLPKRSLERLVELVSSEILNELLRTGFQSRMSKVIGDLNGSHEGQRSEGRRQRSEV
ncbi:MAG: ExeA family protein [Candidatus Binatia bacterium]